MGVCFLTSGVHQIVIESGFHFLCQREVSLFFHSLSPGFCQGNVTGLIVVKYRLQLIGVGVDCLGKVCEHHLQFLLVVELGRHGLLVRDCCMLSGQ